MTQEQIATLENKIKRDYGNTAGAVVLKNDAVAYEGYFNGCSRDETVHIFSVTKSILSILFGIAVDKGCIKSLDEKVIDFFPSYQIKKREKNIQHVTVKHLLTMTAPYKYKFNPYTKFFSSDDWVTASLDLLGGNGKIGEFRYAPIIGVDILSGILVNTTGHSVLKFAQENLFSPLEISVENSIFFDTKEDQLHFYKSKGVNGWVADPKGTNTGGWGLSLTTTDMAKLGLLYLKKGRWGNQQIVSEKWVSESTKTQTVWKERGLKYGYLWWVIDEEERSFAALGDGGNTIYVNPRQNLVVALSSLFAPRVKDSVDFIKNDIEPLCGGG